MRHKQFFFSLKIAEIRRGYNYGSEKPFGITEKVILAQFNPTFGDKYRNAMNRSRAEKTTFMTSYLQK